MLSGGKAVTSNADEFDGYNLGEHSLVIDIETDVDAPIIAGVASNDGDSDQTTTLSNITIKGETSPNSFIAGFLYAQGDPTNDTSPTIASFAGTLLTSQNSTISVENTGGSAVGAAFLYIQNFNNTHQKWDTLEIDGSVTLGPIDVSGQDTVGVLASSVNRTGTLTLGRINAVATEGTSHGLRITGGINVVHPDDTVGEDFTNVRITGNITAEAKTDAVGVAVMGDLTGSMSAANTTITARAGETAVGVYLGRMSDNNPNRSARLILGDIEARGLNAQNDHAQEAVGFMVLQEIANNPVIQIGNITAKGINNAAGIGIGDLKNNNLGPASTGNIEGPRITVGTTDIHATEGTAFGWISSSITGNGALSFGAMTVKGIGASGIYIDGNYDGRLETGNITVDGGETDAPNVSTSGIAILGDFRAGTGGTNRTLINGEISVKATTSDNVYGIVIAGDPAQPGNTGEMAGHFYVAGAISATNEGTGDSIGVDLGTIRERSDRETTIVGLNRVDVEADAGNAWGIRLNGDMIGNTTLTTEVIDVTSGDGANTNATGFAAYGKIEGNITTGNMWVDASKAVGFHFTHDIEGSLTTGNIVIDSFTNDGIGLHVGNEYNEDGPTTTPNVANVKVGLIDVKSGQGNAFGMLFAGEVESLTLGGNVTTSGRGNETTGLRAYGGTSITLDANVAFATTHTGTASDYKGADIWASDNLSINLNEKQLTTKNIKMDGAGQTLNIGGAGYANLGHVTMNDGQYIIGDNNTNTTVEIDIMSVLGNTRNNELHSNATLVLDGQIVVGGDYRNLGTFSVRSGTVTGGVYTNLEFNSQGYIVARQAETPLSDAYLAAMLMYDRNTAWNVLQDRFITGNGFGGYRLPGSYITAPESYRGQSPQEYRRLKRFYPANGKGISSGLHAWANYGGRSDSTYESSFNGQNWKLSMDGVQAGTDFIRSDRDQFGLLFGYETGRMTETWRNLVEARNTYLGFYGARVLENGTDVRGAIAHGWQDYKQDRFDNNTRWYQTGYKGNTWEGHVEIGQRISGGPWSLRPAMGLDILHNRLNDAMEWEIAWDPNPPAGLPDETSLYRGGRLTQVFLRVGTEMQLQYNELTLNGGLFYAYDINDGQLGTDVIPLEDAFYTVNLKGTALSRSRLTYNVGGQFQMTRHFAFIGGYRGEYGVSTKQRLGHSGYIGGTWLW